MHVTSLIRSLFEKQFYSNSSNDINLPFFGYKCHYVYRHLASILKVGGGGADWSKKSWQAKRPPVATCLVYNFKNYPKKIKNTHDIHLRLGIYMYFITTKVQGDFSNILCHHSNRPPQFWRLTALIDSPPSVINKQCLDSTLHRTVQIKYKNNCNLSNIIQNDSLLNLKKVLTGAQWVLKWYRFPVNPRARQVSPGAQVRLQSQW